VNPIAEQQALLQEVAEVISEEADPGYASIRCTFGVYPTSFRTAFSFVDNDGDVVSRGMSRDGKDRAKIALRQLQAAMKAHTGGEWNELLATIDEAGEFTARFSHDPEGAYKT
jgi:hypothetical protein